MKITDFITENSIINALKSSNKAEVIQELAVKLCQVEPSLNVDTITKIFLDREELGSTGIGSGVAIPHGKIEGLKKIVAVFGRSPTGIDFDAQDGEPTFLFFALLAPKNSAGLHLKALAKLSRLLKNQAFRQALLEAKKVEDLYTVLADEESN